MRLKKIYLKKNDFFLKVKMIAMEITQSEIAYSWILKNKINIGENKILYSFWSNYLLLTFTKLMELQ